MTTRKSTSPIESNGSSPSTTFEWRRVKIARPPQGHSDSRPQAGRSYFRRLSPFDWRRRTLHLEVKYRGGAECWFEVRARGGVMRTPGVIALVDLMAELANQQA